MQIDVHAPLIANEDVLTRRVGDETVLLHMGTEVYFGLDSVGTVMWEALQSHGTIAAAHAALAPEFDADPERMLADMIGLVEQLVAKGLLTLADE